MCIIKILIQNYFLQLNLLIQIIFINFDSTSPLSCGIEGEPLDTGDVWCVINAEMFDPFIWLTGFLWVIFIVLGFLEPKK